MIHNPAHPDRRGFLGSLAAGTAAVVLPTGCTAGTTGTNAAPATASSAPAAPPPAADFGKYKVGVQSYTFRQFPVEQALKQTQAAGLKYIEFYRGHVPTDSSPGAIAGFRKMAGEYDITPIAFGVERFTKDHDANKKLFEFASALGVKHISADPTPDKF